MNKKLLIGIAGAAIVVVGGFAVAATSGAGGKSGAYTFDTVTVEKGDVSRVVSASGAVQPLNKVDVGSEVSGKIIKMNVDFNSKVKKDEVLAVVDPSTFQSALEQANAALLQSQASVATANANIDHSNVALDIAEKNWKRQKSLYDQQAISQQVWEQTDRDYKFAQVQVTSDKVSLQSAIAGLARSRASLDDARVKLDKTQIRSPMDGVVIARAVDVGQTVQSSMTVAKFFTIAQDLSQIQIEAAVVESDIGGIDVGDPATFTVDAFPGERFQGAVKQVRVLGTEQANVVTYTVVIGAQNSTGKLMPGMTANAEIIADRAANVLRIANEGTKFQPPKDLAEAMAGERKGGNGNPGGAPGGGGQGGSQNASFSGGPGGAGGGQRGGGGAGGRGGFGGNPSNEWLKEIGIDDARVKKISGEMQGEMEKVRASMPAPTQGQNQPLGGGGGGFGPPPSMLQQAAVQEMRNKMQAATDRVMKANLSADEYDAFNKKRAEAQTQKRIVAYTVDDKGKLELHRLVIGVSDGSFAEIIRGAKEGDKFVTKAHPAGEKRPKAAASAPAGQSPLSTAPQGRRGG